MKKIGHLIWGRIYLWFFRPLYKIENFYPIWHGIVNREPVKSLKRLGRAPDELESRILSDLRKDGIAFSSLEELFGKGKLEELLTFADFEHAPRRTNRQKPFISEFLEEMPTVTRDNKLSAIALNERVLTIAGNYIGMAPKLQEFTLTEIKAVPEGAGKSASMRWHRDPHDLRLLKMFVYYVDVGPENGPFTYLRGSNYGNKYGRLFPQTPPSGVYPPDGAVDKAIDKADLVQAIGKAGTVVFADTAGLHWGGHVKQGMRRMSTIGFLPPKSFLIRQLTYKKSPDETLSLLQEYVALKSDRLASRNAYIYLKSLFVGADSVGGHITGMKGWM